MKLIMYCLIIGIANACKYKNGKSTKKLIEMDFIQNGGNYNFKSLKLTFPKLNEVFDCVTNHGDLVDVEVLYKNAEGAFESIGEYQSYTQGTRCLKITEKVSFNIASEAIYVYIYIYNKNA